MLMSLISRIKYKINLNSLKQKCVIGRNCDVNDHRLIINNDGNRESICLGNNTVIKGELMVFPRGKIQIGDWGYVGENSKIWSDESIAIGNRVLIAHNCTVIDSLSHPIDPVERHKHFAHIIKKGYPRNIDLGSKPVTIEDDVWIGCNSVILEGVRIGNCSIVGAGSVITKNVPSWTIVAGNPAHVIRKIPESKDRYLAEVDSLRA
jgi:acetyltransferase-like isoleucine patch superfamily enzyme